MTITRGDTGAYSFKRIDSSGNPITSTPNAIYFTVKASFSDSSVVIQKTISDMTMDVDGTWHFTINPDDTTSLDYGSYVYDIEVTTNNYVKTIAKGKLVIEVESTWTANK